MLAPFCRLAAPEEGIWELRDNEIAIGRASIVVKKRKVLYSTGGKVVIFITSTMNRMS